MNLDLLAEQSPAGDEVPETELTGAAGRILVVDDEASIREFALDALVHGGYQAVAVDGGEVALDAIRAEHYDLVLTDFNMPKGSGANLIIKMHSEGFMQPVIMMTGAALTKELVALTSMLHVRTILEKPFGMDQLLAAVDNILRPMSDISTGLAEQAMNHESEIGAAHDPRQSRF
jgi:DNA-binding NtrC family response regulator